MSLSAREEQALGFIESDLARSDPKLASLLATFARLTSGEEMPVREKIQVVRRRSMLGARRLGQRLGVQRAMALLWLLIALALVAVALVEGSSSGSRSTCATTWATVCTAPATAHSSRPALRQPGQAQPVASGHRGLLPATASITSGPIVRWLVAAGQVRHDGLVAGTG